MVFLKNAKRHCARASGCGEWTERIVERTNKENDLVNWIWDHEKGMRNVYMCTEMGMDDDTDNKCIHVLSWNAKLKANICVKYEVENGEKKRENIRTNERTNEYHYQPKVKPRVKVVDFIANKNIFTWKHREGKPATAKKGNLRKRME